jgi:hypothetical protein
MYKILKYSLKMLLLLPIFLLIYINFSLYYTPSFVKTINQDELAELDFLADELHNKAAGERMQSLFPEGFFFIHVIYGLAYADFTATAGIPSNSELGKKAVKEVDFSIAALHSAEGKSNFLDKLPLENGAFYKGWSSYLMGRRLQMTGEYETVLAQQFKINCDAISQAIGETDDPFLESYNGAAWPADNVVCLAALSLHDRIFTPKYTAVIANWMNRIKTHLDTKTGLIPHSFSLFDDKGIEVRGSSQSLMLSFLPRIDPVFARNQYKIYKKWFVQNKLGLPAVREYPIGTEGGGDVDSGPVIWDVGGSASIVGIRAAAENHDFGLVKNLRNSIETFALATNFSGKKRHFFGALPMIDAFVAWANAENQPWLEQQSGGIAWFFHLISLLIIVPFCWWVYRL